MAGIISEKVFRYSTQINDKNHRYLSWEHCFKYFNEENIEIEKSCLHLSFYLASWGMYRGSSFLLWKDYLLHKEIVEKIISVRKDFQNINFASVSDTDLKEIIKLCDFIRVWYSKNTGKINGEDRKTIPSDILITKILLGTLGCLPAYDRFFVFGLSTHKIAPKTVSLKGLKQLVEFYKENKSEFDQLQKFNIGKITYPVMKLIDMYFWQIGFENSN